MTDIDNADYDTDNLSKEAKVQLACLQFCDRKLARLQAQTCVANRKERLTSSPKGRLPVLGVSDTIKIS